MLIDWFTVGAQVLNFLVLMWLLKRFLYKPILNAIDVREKRVAADVADAIAKRTEAQRERDDFQDKNKTFDAQRGALLSKAVDEATAERQRLLDEARKEADGLRAKEDVAIQRDRVRLGHEIARLAKEEVFGIARKALADLATVSLEERFTEVFTRRLREMDGKAKDVLFAALKSSEVAVLRSTFDLPTVQKVAIQNALNETFSAEIRVRFETAQDALCGIELTANGQKLGWSIASYLKSLEEKVDDLLRDPSKPATQSEPRTSLATTPNSVAHAEAQ